MDDEEYVDVFLSGEFTEAIGNLILKVKLTWTYSLLTEQELKVINTYLLNVVGVNGVFKSFKQQIDWCATKEVQEVQRKLLKLIEVLVEVRIKFVSQFLSRELLKHSLRQDFVLDFKGAPESRHILSEEVN